MAYADWAYYHVEFGGSAEQVDIEPKLDAASDAIDALTFNRIVGIGWDNLTEFQRSKVMRACCVQADFMLENADAIESAMTRYSINGVTMEFGNAALYRLVEGVPVANAAVSLLGQSGLTSRLATYREVEPCGGRRW